jgi:hypothetical protein
MKKVFFALSLIVSFNATAQNFWCGATSNQLPPPSILTQQATSHVVSDPQEK